MSISTNIGYYRGELLIVGKKNGVIEIYREDFKLIYRSKNIVDGMAILRNDLHKEVNKLEAQKSISDVTGNIESSCISFSTEKNEQKITIKETLLVNINSKVIFLIHLSSEDILLYEGYYYDRDSPNREDLPLRFKRMKIGNELVQLTETTHKSIKCRRFNLFKDKLGNLCVFIIMISQVFWLFIGRNKKAFLHKGIEKGQVQSASLFSTKTLPSAYLICEDNLLKICELSSFLNYQYQYPFQRKRLDTVPTKLAQYISSKDSNDKYIIAVTKQCLPITFDISTVPQTYTQEVSICISVLGEQYKYSIIALSVNNPKQIVPEINVDKGEIINTIAVIPLSSNNCIKQYLFVGISRIPLEASESATTGRLVLYSVSFC